MRCLATVHLDGEGEVRNVAEFDLRTCKLVQLHPPGVPGRVVQLDTIQVALVYFPTVVSPVPGGRAC